MAARTGTESVTRGSSVVPVFFDAGGKRWRRILTSAGLVAFTATAAIVMLTVSALRPVRAVPQHWASEYPAQLLSESDVRTMPVIGGEGVDALVRVDLVQHRAGVTYLMDPFTGRAIRTATAAEASAIGTHPYALEWYGHPAAHQLVLTFDDGPDPGSTPEILDILSPSSTSLGLPHRLRARARTIG